jgi:hypothetical protein
VLHGTSDYRAEAKDGIGRPLHYLGCDRIEMLAVDVELAINREIGAFDKAVLAQLTEESGEEGFLGLVPRKVRNKDDTIGPPGLLSPSSRGRDQSRCSGKDCSARRQDRSDARCRHSTGTAAAVRRL